MWGFSKKPVDPLVARERELQAELARLQGEVARLAREEPAPAAPARETLPGASTSISAKPFARPVPSVSTSGGHPPKGHLNEFGGRKYDLSAAWRRLVNHLRGPTANNPGMARMLAAGSIHGLRPLRYERRVARNRFVALFVILLLILWGLGYTYLRHR
jgi:hypothetical protein